ncbi:MAG: molybdopterin-dependent oxidoreductase [Desulfurococcales archaeon]|nr:molybdopterin-dependent oxidoreductase [Desulfurococcales archaeon]
MTILEWCQIYRNWITLLTGYQTVIDCKPEPSGQPSSVIAELYDLLATYVEPSTKLPRPNPQSPEVIGQRYVVYKSIGGSWKDPIYEVRAVIDKESGAIIWAGGVYKHMIPGTPEMPTVQPSLPEPPENIDPPSKPRGQKIIPNLVVYTAEGIIPEKKEPSIKTGYFGPSGPRYTGMIEPRRDQWIESTQDFHCVTGWSVEELQWKGIPLPDLLAQTGLRGEWILVISSGGYATIFPYDERVIENGILVTGMGEDPLPKEHGGPYRLVLPRLYGWKSLKWVETILVGDVYLDGYWEARGYHWRGLVVLDERFKRYINS